MSDQDRPVVERDKPAPVLPVLGYQSRQDLPPPNWQLIASGWKAFGLSAVIAVPSLIVLPAVPLVFVLWFLAALGWMSGVVRSWRALGAAEAGVLPAILTLLALLLNLAALGVALLVLVSLTHFLFGSWMP